MSVKQAKYNLQIPIEKELEDKLRQLAADDDRTLRAYCRRILAQHANSLIRDIQVEAPVAPIANIETIKPGADIVPIVKDDKKKKKVAALKPSNI